MSSTNDKQPLRIHPRKFEWIVAIPAAITAIVCVLSLGSLYEIWLEPLGLHIWMEQTFPKAFSGFDLYTDNPTRYKVTFSWIILVSTVAGLFVSLTSIHKFYPYVIEHPKPYLVMGCLFILFLSIFLLFRHGAENPEWSLTRGTRRIIYSGLYSFAFWSIVLGLSAFYAWTALLSGIAVGLRRFWVGESHN